MIGNFGSVSLKDVVGYKISANWTPNHGFQGYFYVYVWDMQNPQTQFGEAVVVGKEGAPTRGNLVIEDGLRTYTFTNIDLMSAQIGATRRYRYRLLEFKYDTGVINAPTQATPVKVQNTSPERVALGGLKTDYQYALDQGAENLLGFRYRPASTGSNIVRLSTLRNNQNCFMEKMIKANDDKNNNKAMTAFNVTLTQATLNVKQENLLSWYIDESYGFMLGEEQPPLSSLEGGQDADKVRQAITSKMQDYTQRELLKLDRQQDPVAREADPRTVETATFVFIPGTTGDISVV